ncbi:hypothetical protein DHEL01_v206437 [Diaporthe helianthi]|uniref:Transmembrane protein n=1 Tax=Diaporthe helianthi TaxID=158607 RepID=A0A2P5HY48_DIAHE|nr:hypothetical protein DHEL01_v206437 [Diaporthe helianthi]
MRTFETMTRPNSESSSTVSARDSSHDDDDGESGISGYASASPSTTTPSHAYDFTRSAATFMMIKAGLASWAVILVGMLTYAVAQYSKDAFAEEPIPVPVPADEDPERTEDHEQTTLLDHENV